MIGTKFTYENPNNYNNRNIIKLGTKNCLIENCDFYNNMLRSSEGAILLSGNNISIKNCNFKNYGQSKQALVVSGSNISVFNCNFISNNGGGVCFSGVEFGTIKNCYFTKNRGYSIIFERYSKNCKLINCTFENNSKPLISWNCAFGEIISCKFLENASYSEIFNGDKTYCKLINSTGYGTPTNISIDRTNFHYKDKIIIHFRNLNDGRIVYASKLIIDIGNYHYEIDTPNIRTVSDPDYVSLDISNIKEEGKYNATIYFTGNNQYDSTSLHELLTIKIKRATKIIIPNEIVSYKPTIELVGTLYGGSIGSESYNIVSKKNLTFSCNNKIYNVYNNGKLFIDLSPGTYEVITSFDGDDIFESCRVVSIIKVLPSILLENLKTEYDEQVNFTTQFLNEDGDNLKYQYVLYNLDGEDNILVTNENGLVNFNKRLTSGVHTLKIVNTLTKEELIKTIFVKTSVIPTIPTNPTTPTNSVIKTTLTLKTVKVKKSAKKLVLQATLKQGNKALSGKKIILKFNGKKYTAKTNKNGVAKVTIKKNVLKKLKVGKKVKYQASYGKITVKKTAKVKK